MTQHITKNEIEQIVNAAVEAKKGSYSPYSHYCVGAAILTESGEIVTGANVENSSFGLTICAERVAACKAVTAGHKKFKAVAVATESIPAVMPCGACRQTLSEFSEKLQIYAVGPDGEIIETSLDEILPYRFSSSHLRDFSL